MKDKCRVVVWEANDCKLLPTSITKIEIKKNKKGEWVARLNNEKWWRMAFIDEQTGKITIV